MTTLPSLPVPAMKELDPYQAGAKSAVLHWYTDDQMREYGAACAAAERERVLSLCASLTWHQRDPSKWCSDDVAYAQGYNAAQDEIAAAIRAQEKP